VWLPRSAAAARAFSGAAPASCRHRDGGGGQRLGGVVDECAASRCDARAQLRGAGAAAHTLSTVRRDVRVPTSRVAAEERRPLRTLPGDAARVPFSVLRSSDQEVRARRPPEAQQQHTQQMTVRLSPRHSSRNWASASASTTACCAHSRALFWACCPCALARAACARAHTCTCALAPPACQTCAHTPAHARADNPPAPSSSLCVHSYVVIIAVVLSAAADKDQPPLHAWEHLARVRY
jgi:hypothetical protein